MNDIELLEHAVRQVRERLAAILGAPWEGDDSAPSPGGLAAALSGADGRQVCAVTVAVEEAGRLVDALRVVAAGEVHDRSLPERGDDGLAFAHGLRRGWQLLERLTRVSPAEARRRTLLGAAARPRTTLDGTVLPPAHPLVGAALAAGGIGVDAAEVVVRCLDQAASVGCPDPVDLAAAGCSASAGSATTD